MLIKYILILSCLALISAVKDPDIAIIGAGIGGTTACYYLRELLGVKANIDIYESRHVGGRLGTVQLGGDEYEAGGAVIHPANEYMLNFTNRFGLEKREENGRFGIFDGKEMIFDASANDYILALQLIYRYGFDVFKLNSYIKRLLKDFSRIYEHQNMGYSFSTVENLLTSMSPDFVEYLKKTARAEMKEVGLSDAFIDELVTAALRTNYGQGASVNGFVGSISMAGIEPGLWSIVGGNKRVPEEIIKHVDVNLIEAKVKNITLKDAKNTLKYAVASVAKGSQQVKNKMYDIVIIATPLHDKLSNINFREFPEGFGKFPQHYIRKPTYFIRGEPNTKHFGLKDGEKLPEALLTNNLDYNICSIGEHYPVTDNHKDDSEPSDTERKPIYKVFTKAPLSEDELQAIFPDYQDKKLVDWAGAYPIYDSPNKPIPPFKLHQQMYYVNGIELAASAMEMSAIAGRNVALLAYDFWRGMREKVDSDVVIRREADDYRAALNEEL